MAIKKILTLLIVILLGTAGYFLPHGRFETANTVYIHITGAVENPGIVSIREGDTIRDAIIAAGGALPDANLSRIDLNRKLSCAQLVNIPCRQ